MRRVVLMLALTSLLAAPAAAEPLLPPGGQGPVLAYRYAGVLGQSGLSVEATPTMLLVRAVAPGSPAALVDLPAPGEARVRLAAVNGQPVEAFALSALQAAFNPARGEVRLTFGKLVPGEVAERLVGPYTLPLSAQAIAERQAHWLADQRRFEEAAAIVRTRKGDPAWVAEELILEAEDAARAGEAERAFQLGLQAVKLRPVDAETRRRFNVWRRQAVEARLAKAERLAEAGQFAAAIQALGAVPAEAPWQARKLEREQRWRAAIAHQAAYRKAKAEEKAKKEREARAEAERKRKLLRRRRR